MISKEIKSIYREVWAIREEHSYKFNNKEIIVIEEIADKLFALSKALEIEGKLFGKSFIGKY
jgi:hypothetical protein